MKSIKSRHKNLDIKVILLLLVLFGVVSTIYLDQFPKVWMDEAWNSTTTYSFQLDGTFRNMALVSASRGNQDVHFLQPSLVPNVISAPLFSLMGVGSVQGRLASVFMGALVVIGMYLLSRKIGGVVFASTCTLFLIFDNLIFVTERTIRPEIFVTAFAIWELYLVVDEEGAFWKYFLCGILLGISLYVHPNSFLVVIAVLIIVLSRVKVQQFWQILLPVGLGLFIGFLPYALYVGFQDGANHFRDFWLQINGRAGIITNTGSLLSNALAVEMSRYSSYIFFPYRLLIFLIQIVAIGWAFYKRADRFNRSLLAFIFVHVLLFPILISVDNSRYLTVLVPMVAILVVKMIWDMANWSYDIDYAAILESIKKLSLRTIMPIAIALILFVNQAGGDVWAVWQSRDCSFTPFIAQVRNLVPPGKSVWGSMFLWFGFYDHPYRTEITIDNSQEMGIYRPDYVILYDSEIWGNQTGVTKRLDPFYVSMAPVRQFVGQLVDDRGVLVGSVSSSCYGNVKVYQLHW